MVNTQLLIPSNCTSPQQFHQVDDDALQRSLDSAWLFFFLRRHTTFSCLIGLCSHWPGQIVWNAQSEGIPKIQKVLSSGPVDPDDPISVLIYELSLYLKALAGKQRELEAKRIDNAKEQLTNSTGPVKFHLTRFIDFHAASGGKGCYLPPGDAARKGHSYKDVINKISDELTELKEDIKIIGECILPSTRLSWIKSKAINLNSDIPSLMRMLFITAKNIGFYRFILGEDAFLEDVQTFAQLVLGRELEVEKLWMYQDGHERSPNDIQHYRQETSAIGGALQGVQMTEAATLDQQAARLLNLIKVELLTIFGLPSRRSEKPMTVLPRPLHDSLKAMSRVRYRHNRSHVAVVLTQSDLMLTR